MYETEYSATKDILAQQRFRRNWFTVLFAITFSSILAVMLALSYLMPKAPEARILLIGVSIALAMGVPILIWHFPRAGLFSVFACCTLFDQLPAVLNPQKLTANAPFFVNINIIGVSYGIPGLDAIKFSPVEIVILLALFAWLIRAIATRTFTFVRGPFWGILVLYGLSTLMGLIHGYATGGDFQIALWEIRPQFQPLVMYILTLNLVTERKHLVQLLWVALIGIGLLAIVGVISYFQLNGVVTDQGILDHEDSLIIDAFLMLFLYLGVSKADVRMTRVGFLFLPFAVFTLLENQRRAGIAALVIALIASLPVLYVVFKEKRRQISRLIAVIALFMAVYLPAAWNAEGAWALPARAIRSTTAPSERDAGSDNYRIMEDLDLKYTRDLSPLVGYGYGKPFIQIYVLPRVSTAFLGYFAHDSVLWLWTSTGHIGFFVFLFFVAVICIRGLQICRQTQDPLLIVAGLAGVSFLIMAYIYGKYDLQLTNTRTMTMLGVWLGLLGVLPVLAKNKLSLEEGNTTTNEDQDALLLDAPAFMAENVG